jgi:hypothetical protein
VDYSRFGEIARGEARACGPVLGLLVEAEEAESERMTRMKGKDVEDKSIVLFRAILAIFFLYLRHPLRLSLSFHQPAIEEFTPSGRVR